MKYNFRNIFVVIIFLGLLPACKKEENRISYTGGNPPVLQGTAMTTPILTAARKDSVAFSLSWTPPNYMFTTGVNSQDVTYTIQIDTTGSNFTNPKKGEIVVPKVESHTLTVGALNLLLTKMELAPGIAHNLEVRVISTIGPSAVPLTSNVLKYPGVVPYEDFIVEPPVTDQLFFTGDAFPAGWVNNATSQMLTRVKRGLYVDTVTLAPGKMYKFLSVSGQWQPQYGGNSATGGPIGFNLGGGSDPDAIPTPAVAGSYEIVVDFKKGIYTVTKL